MKRMPSIVDNHIPPDMGGMTLQWPVREKLIICGIGCRGSSLGDRKYRDPDLQAERHRPARLAHRRAAADRLRANQKPGTAHTAAVELAPTLHHRSRVITATTAYLAASSSRQSSRISDAAAPVTTQLDVSKMTVIRLIRALSG